MADEVDMTPVTPAEMTPVSPAEVPPVTVGEPPKTNPLARPTAMLKPGLRMPPKPSGAATAALKPGLKLPTQNALKPGLKLPTQTALRPGVKLPPKPGAATAALKPGLKLPTQNALKPGLKLPTQTAIKPGVRLPTKPVIRKPGATVAAAPLPKPVTPLKADVAATDAAPEPPKAVASEPAKPAAPAPAKAAEPPKPVAVDAQGVAKLPTVSAPAIPRAAESAPAATPPAPEASKPLEALKSVTQKLKGITQEIPAQAILHKTGIIADADMSESQKEAAKHKTARISLSEAMGVAPVKSENAPMKTIRIKRPVGIGGAQRPTSSLPPPVTTPENAAKPGTEVAANADAPTETAATATTAAPSGQPVRKTLKISRPGGAVRPTKFGIKRPTTVSAVPKQAASADGGDAARSPADGEGAVADIPEVTDIPDISIGASAPVAKAGTSASDGPAWLWSLSSIVQAAACVAIGALAWLLYQNTQTLYF